MEKLLEKYFSTSDYYIEKLFEGISREDCAEFADGVLDLVINEVNQFREAIKRRNMDFYERLQDEYELIEHAKTELRKYYRGDTVVEKPTAKIYAIFLKHQIDKLKAYAKEIDDEYAK
jgi:ubiquitin C-terminal hydrolase